MHTIKLSNLLHVSKDFTLLKAKYRNILQSFPEDHQQTLGKLQDSLTDQQMSEVLDCTDSDSANKMMLDYLINNIKCREDILDFCDQLDKLTYSLSLLHVVNELRNGMQDFSLSYNMSIIILFIYCRVSYGNSGNTV